MTSDYATKMRKFQGGHSLPAAFSFSRMLSSISALRSGLLTSSLLFTT